MPPKRVPLVDRIWSKVEKSDGCWLWTGMTRADGYGLIWGDGRPRPLLRAHRVVYELLVGPIPADTELDHLCRVKRCVRPDHLEAVDHRLNVMRGVGPTAVNAAKETCDAGHPLTVVASRGDRGCRICINARRRASHREPAPS